MAEPLPPAQLVEVLRAERRRRWEKGDRVLAEAYLRQHPAIRADPTLAVELVYHEILLREERGETFALEEYLRRFPELADHPHTLTTLDNLAGAYWAAGRTAEAIAFFEQVRDARVQQMGANHPDTFTTLNNLAVVYRAAGKLEQALSLSQQAASGIEKRQFRHPHAASIVDNLSACHERLKQYESAEAWRRKWLAVVQERAGPQSPAYAAALAGLGRNLLRQQKHADAEPTLRACLDLRTKQQPDAWTTFNTRSMLGEALAGQHKYAEAEPLLLAGYEGMQARAQGIPPRSKVRLTEALDRLVQLYDAWGKKDQAEQWRKRRAADAAQAPAPKPL